MTALDQVRQAARRHEWDPERGVWTIRTRDYLELMVGLHEISKSKDDTRTHDVEGT